MARRRSAALGLLAALAILGGTAAVLFSSARDGPRYAGIHGPGRRPGEGADRGLPATGRSPGEDAGPPDGTPEAQYPASVVVRVLRLSNATPIPGARVSLQDLAGVRSGVTDEAGRVRLDGVEAGTATLVVRAGGFADRSEVRLLARGENPPLDVLLADSRPLLGRVVSAADGRPVAGAEVRTSIDRGLGLLQFPRASAACDADGNFRLEAIETGQSLRLSVQAAGYVPVSGWPALPAEAGPEPRVTVRLDPTASIRGTVRDPSGGVCPDAFVVAVPAATGVWHLGEVLAEWARAGKAPGRSRAGANGSFVLEDLAGGGLYLVGAVAPGHASSPAAEVLLPEAGGEVRQDLQFRAVAAAPETPVQEQADAVLEGVVLGTDGAPVAGAQVSASPLRSVEQTWTEFAPARVVPAGGWTASEEWREARASGAQDLPPSRWARTDEEGRFQIPGLRPGAPYRLHASCSGAFSRPGDPVTAPASGIEIPLALRFGRVKGRLLLPAGAEVPKSLELLLAGTEAGAAIRAERPRGFGDGTFETMPSLPGPLRIAARAGEHVLPPRQVEVPSGETLDLGDLPLVAGAAVRGRVVDPEGIPVVGANVANAGYGGPWTAAGADGRFALGPLPEGEVDIVLSTMFGPSVTRRVRATRDGDVGDLVLPRGGVLRASVRDGGGRPVLVRFEVRGPGGGESLPVVRGGTDHLGRFALVLAPGAYEVRIFAAADGGEAPLAAVAAAVKEGRETGLEIRVRR